MTRDGAKKDRVDDLGPLPAECSLQGKDQKPLTAGGNVLEKLTAKDFQDWIGQKFRVDVQSESIELELLESNELGQGTDRKAFSVVFRGPADKMLVQASYPTSGGGLEKELLFLVPVGPDKQGMLYEAVFT